MTKLLIGAAVAALAAPLLAQVPAVPPVAPTARSMADRVETRDEVVARVREHFARMDANRDGFIAAEEMPPMPGMAMGGMRDDEGREHGPMGDPNAVFNRLDTNRDGVLSREEFARGREVRIERRIALSGKPGRGGMHRMGAMMHGRMLKMADLDRDGRVSLQEAQTSALQHFDRLDANHDGRLTPEERRAGRQQWMRMHRPQAG